MTDNQKQAAAQLAAATTPQYTPVKNDKLQTQLVQSLSGLSLLGQPLGLPAGTHVLKFIGLAEMSFASGFKAGALVFWDGKRHHNLGVCPDFVPTNLQRNAVYIVTIASFEASNGKKYTGISGCTQYVPETQTSELTFQN